MANTVGVAVSVRASPLAAPPPGEPGSGWPTTMGRRQGLASSPYPPRGIDYAHAQGIEPFHDLPEVEPPCANFALVDIRRWLTEFARQFTLCEPRPLP